MSGIGLNRRRFCGAAAATFTLGAVLLDFRKKVEAMTQVSQQTSADTTAIRPFHINIAEAELIELHQRIKPHYPYGPQADKASGSQTAYDNLTTIRAEASGKRER
jgi:hypothetical protein